MLSQCTRAFAHVSMLCVSLIVAACGSQQPPPIDVQAITQVQSEIKRQVGIYFLAARDHGVYTKIGGDIVDLKKTALWCGGDVDFDITTVTAELTTTNTASTDFSFELKPPLPTSTLAISAGYSRARENSQTLTYKLWLADPALQNDDFKTLTAAEPQVQGAPIAAVLLNLRKALVASNTRIDYMTGQVRDPQPCFTDFDPSKPLGDAGHSYKIGLTITTDAKGSVGVTVGAVGPTIGAEEKRSTGQTLTVTFVQRNVKQVQDALDVAAAKCKDVKPGQKDAECDAAKAKVDDEIKKRLFSVKSPINATTFLNSYR